VKRSCSANGCKVLAETGGQSCSDYCRKSGRACTGAWEEVNDDCEVLYAWSCDQPLAGTSDLLCECDVPGDAQGDVHGDAQGGGESKMCSGMPGVKRSCSANGCKVLAETGGQSCSDYCRKSGRACTGAWEEVNDDCEVLYAWSCDQPLAGTSDLLCECDVESSGSVPTPTPGPTAPAGLRLVWSDEFNGGSVDGSKWSFVRGGGGFGNGERQYYSSQNAMVQDGALRIVAKCEERSGQGYTSAKLITRGLAEWGPGHRIEVRARLPQGKGTWPAIWMLPVDKVYGGWPKSGEIDIMEAVGCTRDKVYGTVHTGRYNHMKSTEKGDSMRTQVAAWHTYSIEWEDRQIRWYVDETLYHTFSPSAFDSERWPFDQKFYLILNLAVGGSWGGYCLSSRPSCSSPDEFGEDQVMQIDFARVYSMS